LGRANFWPVDLLSLWPVPWSFCSHLQRKPGTQALCSPLHQRASRCSHKSGDWWSNWRGGYRILVRSKTCL
jgi:hypothetical protein